MMEWLRDTVMLLRLTTMRYFLSRNEQESVFFCQRRGFALEDPEKIICDHKRIFGNGCFRIFDHKLTGEGSVK